jgi:hypothetical protein
MKSWVYGFLASQARKNGCFAISLAQNALLVKMKILEDGAAGDYPLLTMKSSSSKPAVSRNVVLATARLES